MKLSTQVILLAAVTMLVVVMLVMADEDICDDINAKGLLKMNSMFLYDNRLYIFQGDKYYSESTFGWVVDPKKPLFTLRGKHFIESKKSHFKERMAIVNYLRPHNNIDKNSDLLYKGDDYSYRVYVISGGKGGVINQDDNKRYPTLMAGMIEYRMRSNIATRILNEDGTYGFWFFWCTRSFHLVCLLEVSKFHENRSAGPSVVYSIVFTNDTHIRFQPNTMFNKDDPKLYVSYALPQGFIYKGMVYMLDNDIDMKLVWIFPVGSLVQDMFTQKTYEVKTTKVDMAQFLCQGEPSNEDPVVQIGDQLEDKETAAAAATNTTMVSSVWYKSKAFYPVLIISILIVFFIGALYTFLVRFSPPPGPTASTTTTKPTPGLSAIDTLLNTTQFPPPIVYRHQGPGVIKTPTPIRHPAPITFHRQGPGALTPIRHPPPPPTHHRKAPQHIGAPHRAK